MARSTPHHALLISRAPELHHELIYRLHLEGRRVFAARRPSEALLLLRRHPEIVFVDLTLGALLTPPLVRAINREHGSTRVAIHSGNLEATDPSAARLSVDGFWRAGHSSSIN